MIFPPVKHKLPELFQLIIKADTLLGLIRQSKTPNFLKYKEYKADREKYVRRAYDLYSPGSNRNPHKGKG